MENLPPTIFIALGVIAAALISGFWSLISLIIAKDQKISEFRQAWIDSLRDDVAEFLGQLEALAVSWHCFRGDEDKPDPGKRFLEHNVDRLAKIEGYKNRILLRLNPSEHVNLLSLLNRIEKMAQSPDSFGSDSFISLCTDFAKQSQELLKKEWERVKRGERAFRYFRNVSFGIVVVSCLAILYRLYA